MQTYGLEASKIARIMNPMDDSLWFPERRPETRDALGVPRDALLVVWHGRIDFQQKGIDVLLDAWGLVRSRMADQPLHLLLVGSGPRRRSSSGTSSGDGRRRHHVDRRVHRRPITDAPDSVERGSLRVSHREAKASRPLHWRRWLVGWLVVAADANGVPDILEDGEASGGVLVRRGDAQPLADAMVELLEDPARRHRLATQAQARVADAFSLEAVGSALATTFRSGPAFTKRQPGSIQHVETVASAVGERDDADRPLVSVVMNFFNVNTDFFHEAIESVIHQTYGNWELLLVDDGSTDRSTDVALRYAREYPDKIRYLEHEGHENRGTSAAHNLGFQNAAGKYVAMLDADDLWLPEKLEKQVAIMEAKPEAGMVYGSTWVWHGWTGNPEDAMYDRGRNLGVHPDTMVEPPLLVTLFLQMEAQTPGTCSVLMRRELVDDVGGFDESFECMYDDHAFFFKLCLKAPVFVEGGCWDRYRRHLDSACHVAEAVGSYDPYEPHTDQLKFLNWFEQYAAEQGVDDPYVRQALTNALRPYRDPDRRAIAQRHRFEAH